MTVAPNATVMSSATSVQNASPTIPELLEFMGMPAEQVRALLTQHIEYERKQRICEAPSDFDGFENHTDDDQYVASSFHVDDYSKEPDSNSPAAGIENLELSMRELRLKEPELALQRRHSARNVVLQFLLEREFALLVKNEASRSGDICHELSVATTNNSNSASGIFANEIPAPNPAAAPLLATPVSLLTMKDPAMSDLSEEQSGEKMDESPDSTPATSSASSPRSTCTFATNDTEMSDSEDLCRHHKDETMSNQVLPNAAHLTIQVVETAKSKEVEMPSAEAHDSASTSNVQSTKSMEVEMTNAGAHQSTMTSHAQQFSNTSLATTSTTEQHLKFGINVPSPQFDFSMNSIRRVTQEVRSEALGQYKELCSNNPRDAATVLLFAYPFKPEKFLWAIMHKICDSCKDPGDYKELCITLTSVAQAHLRTKYRVQDRAALISACYEVPKDFQDVEDARIANFIKSASDDATWHDIGTFAKMSDFIETSSKKLWAQIRAQAEAKGEAKFFNVPIRKPAKAPTSAQRHCIPAIPASEVQRKKIERMDITAQFFCMQPKATADCDATVPKSSSRSASKDVVTVASITKAFIPLSSTSTSIIPASPATPLLQESTPTCKAGMKRGYAALLRDTTRKDLGNHEDETNKGESEVEGHISKRVKATPRVSKSQYGRRTPNDIFGGSSSPESPGAPLSTSTALVVTPDNSVEERDHLQHIEHEPIAHITFTPNLDSSRPTRRESGKKRIQADAFRGKKDLNIPSNTTGNPVKHAVTDADVEALRLTHLTVDESSSKTSKNQGLEGVSDDTRLSISGDFSTSESATSVATTSTVLAVGAPWMGAPTPSNSFEERLQPQHDEDRPFVSKLSVPDIVAPLPGSPKQSEHLLVLKADDKPTPADLLPEDKSEEILTRIALPERNTNLVKRTHFDSNVEGLQLDLINLEESCSHEVRSGKKRGRKEVSGDLARAKPGVELLKKGEPQRKRTRLEDTRSGLLPYEKVDTVTGNSQTAGLLSPMDTNIAEPKEDQIPQTTVENNVEQTPSDDTTEDTSAQDRDKHQNLLEGKRICGVTYPKALQSVMNSLTFGNTPITASTNNEKALDILMVDEQESSVDVLLPMPDGDCANLPDYMEPAQADKTEQALGHEENTEDEEIKCQTRSEKLVRKNTKELFHRKAKKELEVNKKLEAKKKLAVRKIKRMDKDREQTMKKVSMKSGVKKFPSQSKHPRSIPTALEITEQAEADSKKSFKIEGKKESQQLDEEDYDMEDSLGGHGLPN